MRTAPVLLAALAAVCLTACTTEVSGSSGPPTRARDLLGDLRTISPCSLVDVAAFTKFGGAERGYSTGFDRCVVDVGGSDGGDDAIVATGQLIEMRPEVAEVYELVRNLPGGMWVREYHGDGICGQLLGFTDGIALRVDAIAVERSTNSSLCELAETATQEVHKVIRAGDVEHREYAQRSLGRLDACDLVSGNPLAGTVLYSNAERRPQPAGHECLWQVGEVGTGSVGRIVQLTFMIGWPVEDGTDETRTVGGRRSVVTKSSDDDGSSCEVRTEHIAHDGDDAVERARVYASGPVGKVDEVCAGALAVAEAAWPKLPAK